MQVDLMPSSRGLSSSGLASNAEENENNTGEERYERKKEARG